MVSQLRDRRVPKNNPIIIQMIVNTEDNPKSFFKLSSEYVNTSTKTLGRHGLKMWTVDTAPATPGLQQAASHRHHKPREECEGVMHQEESSQKAR